MPKSRHRARSRSNSAQRQPNPRGGAGLSAPETRILAEYLDWCTNHHPPDSYTCNREFRLMRGLFVVTRRLGHGLTLAQPYVRTLEILLGQIQLIVEPDGRTIRSSDGQTELDMSTLIDFLTHYVVFLIRKAGWPPSDNAYLSSLALLVKYEDELDEYADRYSDDEDAFRYAIDDEYDMGGLLTVDRSSVTLCTCGLAHDEQG